jgi:hypothetical protein
MTVGAGSRVDRDVGEGDAGAAVPVYSAVSVAGGEVVAVLPGVGGASSGVPEGATDTGVAVGNPSPGVPAGVTGDEVAVGSAPPGVPAGVLDGGRSVGVSSPSPTTMTCPAWALKGKDSPSAEDKMADSRLTGLCPAEAA